MKRILITDYGHANTRLFAGTFAIAAGSSVSAPGQNKLPAKRPEELIESLKSADDAVSSAACDSAPEYGPAAVRPLAFEMGNKDFELARRAKRALYRLVRHAGRPGAEKEASALQGRLVGVLHSRTVLPTVSRREVIWMLSEIGNADAVCAIAELLSNNDLREDARCALTRMPMPEAVAALKAAVDKAEEGFKYALADSLRVRGVNVQGYPSKKMVPTAQTTVVALQPKK